MINKKQKALLNAAAKIFHPLVKIFLKHSLDYGTVTEMIRKAYVDAAFEHIAESGKRPTISAVSAITGLTRKEAKRLNELDSPESHTTHQRYNRSIRVISGWLNDTRFLDENNEPARLPLDGDNSFASLVKSYSGDIPASSMLSVLETSKSVLRKGDSLTLLKHAYIPANDPIEKIEILGADVAELVSTIGHNLSAPEEQLHFQRKVSNCLIPEQSLEAFKKFSAYKSQQLLEEFNHWLGEHESDGSDDSNPTNYVAVGIYYTQKSHSPSDRKTS